VYRLVVDLHPRCLDVAQRMSDSAESASLLIRNLVFTIVVPGAGAERL
jgi:hypothetical protein